MVFAHSKVKSKSLCPHAIMVQFNSNRKMSEISSSGVEVQGKLVGSLFSHWLKVWDHPVPFPMVAFGLQVIKEEKWLDLLLTAAAHIFFLQPGSCRPPWPADSTFMCSQDCSCLNRELQVHRSWKERNRSEFINVLSPSSLQRVLFRSDHQRGLGVERDCSHSFSFLLGGGRRFFFSRDRPSFT